MCGDVGEASFYVHAQVEKRFMEDTRAKAALYRNRATELRAIADSYRHDATYDSLMKIAHDYDQMAATIDAVAALKAASKSASGLY